MKQIWIVAKRELRSFFDSLMAYIMLIAFLGFSGFFTWLYGQGDIFFIKQASLQAFFGIAYWTLFFFIPALTMRLFAEENRSGTIELLLTKPLNDWQVVWGKFLATLMLILVALLLTIPYYITVASLGPIDHGAVWSGYFGLILMSAAYISIGIFTSAISTNQIVSYLLALFIGIFFQILFGMLSGAFSGLLSQVLNYLSLNTHFETISRGVIDSKDLIYFLSVIFFGLILTEAVLEKRKLA
ncbi:MAG: ABC transporter permease subunit [Bacteroidales bacterium]|nr:ABC transporter permease subunit [Bacteroidales bacterium]MCF8387275.1 ABC transporter permease subunit [Bacteroidales bacterium]MCF8396879.1 ABC transporter permease subunit [Bacteroidales bacterium]